MKTRARKENIDKYEAVLKILFHRLRYDKQLSMFKFSQEYNVSKNLSTVLSKGGIIKNLKRGRSTQWEWVSIEPNKDMAVKVLTELGKLNPPRKRGGKREGAGRPKGSVNVKSTKKVIKKTFLWGLYSYQETVK